MQQTKTLAIFPHSIRARLPLSYAAIALVTAVAVGAVLLITLRTYYAERELERMNHAGVSIGLLVERMLEEKIPPDVLQARLDSIAFFSQARIKLLDADQKLIIESRTNGVNMVSFNMLGPTDVVNATRPVQLDMQGNPIQGGYPAPLDQQVSDTLFLVTQDHPDTASITTIPASSGNAASALYSVAGVAAGGFSNTVPVNSDGDTPQTTTSGTIFIQGANGETIQAVAPSSMSPVSGTTDIIQAFPAQPDPTIFTEDGTWSHAASRVFVDGTPYGVRLRPDLDSPQWRSDQVATVVMSNSEKQLMGYLQLSDGPAIGAEIVDRVAWALLGASGIAIVVAAIAGWSISRVITTPLLGLTQITDQMAQGDLSVRAKITSSDEFGSLAKAFNHMTNQVEHTITTLKCFLADAAHELHTPLTALNTNLELAATEPNDSARQSFIERALEQLKRLETLTNNLLILSRIETHSLPDERTRVDLSALVRETSEMYASQAEQMGITFSIDVPAHPTRVTANEAQLRRSLCNLLDNAIKFTEENGSVELGLKNDSEGIKLWVQDTGIGIPNEDLPYLFNRFHRGRNTAAYPGNGLGLAIIKAIVESHNGKVAVDSLEPGTRFTLLLPAT